MASALLWPSSAEKLFLYRAIPERLRTLRYCIFHGKGRKGKRHLQCLFPAETSALRGCFLALNRSKKKHPQTPSGANAQTGRVAGAFFVLGNSALAGLEVVHFLIGFIDQVVHGGDVRLKASAADADLDLIGLAGGGVGGVQLPLDGGD